MKQYFKNLRAKNRKEGRKGFTLVELMIALAIVIALSVAAFFAYGQAQQMRKIAQMNNDLDAIASGALAYESLAVNSTPPTNIDDLITGLTAAQSIDGSAHGNFISSTKAGTGEDATITDPWGVEYTYSQTARTITCTPKDAAGTNLTAVVRRF